MTIVEEAEEDGTFREDETNLIRSAIELDDLEVGDILVPRVNISAINVISSLEKLRALFEKDGYSRVPVFRDTIDTIIGVVHEKDFFNAYLSGEKKIESILQPAVYTTEHMKISSLLRQLQAKKLHMAVVLDEYGGTLGIVTLEDILEELVGEIWDEHDEEIKFFKNVDENTYIVDGKAPLDELFELFEIEKEIDNFEALTVSGWAIETLGEIPNVGKSFEFKSLTIEITKATIRRILEVKVTKQTIETEEK